MRKQSLFHISKRDALPLGKALLIRGGILLLALVVCGLITTRLTGQDPIAVYGTILDGAFGSSRRIGVTFRNVAVLLELCDRIVVLCGGQVSGVVDARTTNKLEVGALMTRVGGGAAEHA